MGRNSHRQSAVIYQFPPRNQVAGRALPSKDKSPAEADHSEHLEVEFGSGWYHEAAIREDRLPHKP